jgi:polyisoprenoid-binding protein YceI
MLENTRTIVALLIIIIGGSASAEQASVTAVDSAAAVNSDDQAASVQGMDIYLDEMVYRIRPETSKMKFRVDSPIGDIWASFKDFEGHFLMFDSGPRHKLASIDINADSLDADAGFIGMMLRSERFFDVDKFPSMRFVGSSLEWYHEKRAVLRGYLTIKGVTREVAFYVEVVDPDHISSNRITVTASTTIKRSAFGIDTLLPAVSDNVNLFMSIDAARKLASVSMN